MSYVLDIQFIFQIIGRLAFAASYIEYIFQRSFINLFYDADWTARKNSHNIVNETIALAFYKQLNIIFFQLDSPMCSTISPRSSGEIRICALTKIHNSVSK